MGILADFDLAQIREKFGCRFLIETGTGRGGGVDYARRFGFERVFSIEIAPELAAGATKRFADDPSVSIINTDSETGLRQSLANVPRDTPVVYWLDAHFPGADYGLAKYDTETNIDRRLPLQREMELIASLRPIAGDVFLIDDLRIYEEGPYEMGNITHLGPGVLPEQRNIRFIETMLAATHTIQRLYKKSGYIVALPKQPAQVNTVEMARSALARNDIAAAEAIATKIRLTEPGNSDALIVLGLAAKRRRDFSLGYTYLAQAAAAAPRNAEALGHLAVINHELGRLPQAEKAFQAALALTPNAPVLLFNFANLLGKLNRPAEAVQLYQRAIVAEPRFVQARIALAKLLEQANHIDPAISVLATATSLAAPVTDDALQLAERLTARGGRLPVEIWQRLAEVRPDDPAIQVRLGTALGENGRRDEAFATLQNVATLPGVTAENLFETGKALYALGEDSAAATAYRSTLALNPDHAPAHNNLSMILFLDGNFEEAWEHHEKRFEAKGRPRPPFPGAPLTTPEITGKTLFFHGEQGLGDNVQFLRYAKILHDRGNRIVVGVRNELVELFRAQDYIDVVVTDGDKIPPIDFHCPLMSLGHVFRSGLASIPAELPYLRVPQERIEPWKKRLSAIKRPRIGLVWAGNHVHYNDANRSISSELFLPTFQDLPQTFISLQKPWPENAQRPEGLLDLGAEFMDFADTAAAVNELDLVITVDTSLSHLTGALGRPVWILLPTPCDWRWTRSGDRTPWYPQAQLFRQTKAGDWGEVLQRVRQQLLTMKG
jgi:Flp pilus assembly protein TadD